MMLWEETETHQQQVAGVHSLVWACWGAPFTRVVPLCLAESLSGPHRMCLPSLSSHPACHLGRLAARVMAPACCPAPQALDLQMLSINALNNTRCWLNRPGCEPTLHSTPSRLAQRTT